MVSDWHKQKEPKVEFKLEKRESMSNQAKTLTMQRDHLVHCWRREIAELRSNAKVTGPHTRKYYEACADSIEKALDEALKEMNLMKYEEIE